MDAPEFGLHPRVYKDTEGFQYGVTQSLWPWKEHWLRCGAREGQSGRPDRSAWDNGHAEHADAGMDLGVKGGAPARSRAVHGVDVWGQAADRKEVYAGPPVLGLVTG